MIPLLQERYWSQFDSNSTWVLLAFLMVIGLGLAIEGGAFPALLKGAAFALFLFALDVVYLWQGWSSPIVNVMPEGYYDATGQTLLFSASKLTTWTAAFACGVFIAFILDFGAARRLLRTQNREEKA